MGSLEVVQGLPGADTQEAPSVPTSEVRTVCTLVNMTHAK